MYRVWFIFVLSLYSCSAVIYHLNETEFARMPPLYGLDDYGSCMAPANGTFCVVRVDLFAEPEDGLIRLIREYSESKLKHYNHTYIQRGICIASTCKNHIKNNSIYTKEGLKEILGECMNETIYAEYGLQSELTDLYYCERKGVHPEIDLGDWIVMGIYIFIALINLVGTVYDIVVSRTASDVKGNKYMLSFSIIQNWNRLVSAEPEELRMRRLTGLHGVRVFTIFLMFTAHIVWINSMAFNDNIQEFEESYESTYYQLIFNGLVVIQVFFVISGFLLVYNLEVHAEKHSISWGLAAKVWVIRWWRLTPSYAIVLAFMTTWLRHLGSGPLWRMFVVDNVVNDCRQHWWVHLLYVNNYVSEGHFCAIHTWHIASDTQLFCIGLLVYVATRHGGKIFVLGLLIALGVILPAAHVWAWDLDGLVLLTPEFFRTFVGDTFHYMHVPGHNNIVCYAIGMTTGYLVYHMQKKGVDLTENKLCIYLAWLIIPVIVALFYSGSVFYQDGERSPLAVRMAYAAAHRLIIGVSVAFGVMGLAMSLNSPLRTFFEWKCWVVPSRLSYSVYLLHLFIIHTYIGLMRQLGHASTFNMTLFHFGVMLLTFMVALPFSLLVEAPLMRLMKVAVLRDMKK